MSNCAVSGCRQFRHPGKSYCLEHFKNQDRDNFNYGLDAEVKNKILAKYDPQKEAEVRAWMEQVIGTRFPSNDFQESLKSGVLLCQLVNKIKPGSVGNISQSKMPFPQRENIVAFLQAISKLGMRETDLFVTQQLFEGDNMQQVLDCLYSFAGLCQKVPGFRGPYLGIRQSDANVRQFTQSQLNEARAVESKQNSGFTPDMPEYARVDKIIKSNAYSSSEPSKQNSGAVADDREYARVDKIIKSNAYSSSEPSKQNQGSLNNAPTTKLDKIVRNVAAPVPPPPQPASNSYQSQSAAPVATKKFCGNCGSKAAGGKFCQECGSAL